MVRKYSYISLDKDIMTIANIVSDSHYDMLYLPLNVTAKKTILQPGQSNKQKWKGLRYDEENNLWEVYLTERVAVVFRDETEATDFLRKATQIAPMNIIASLTSEKATVAKGQEDITGLKDVVRQRRLRRSSSGHPVIDDSVRWNFLYDTEDEAVDALKHVTIPDEFREIYPNEGKEIVRWKGLRYDEEDNKWEVYVTERVSVTYAKDAEKDVLHFLKSANKQTLKQAPNFSGDDHNHYWGECDHCHTRVYSPITSEDYYSKRDSAADVFCPNCGYGISDRPILGIPTMNEAHASLEILSEEQSDLYKNPREHKETLKPLDKKLKHLDTLHTGERSDYYADWLNDGGYSPAFVMETNPGYNQDKACNLDDSLSKKAEIDAIDTFYGNTYSPPEKRLNDAIEGLYGYLLKDDIESFKILLNIMGDNNLIPDTQAIISKAIEYRKAREQNYDNLIQVAKEYNIDIPTNITTKTPEEDNYMTSNMTYTTNPYESMQTSVQEKTQEGKPSLTPAYIRRRQEALAIPELPKGATQEGYMKGIQEESSEHPSIDRRIVKQLVLDHLRKDPNYYKAEVAEQPGEESTLDIGEKLENVYE